MKTLTDGTKLAETDAEFHSLAARTQVSSPFSSMTFGFQDLKVMSDALQQFVDNSPDEEELAEMRDGDGDSMKREVAKMVADAKRAQAALDRINAFIIPLMEGA